MAEHKLQSSEYSSLVKELKGKDTDAVLKALERSFDNDFVKKSGLPPLMNLLNSKNAQISHNALEVLSHFVWPDQQNAYSSLTTGVLIMQEGAKKSTSWKGGERFVKFLDAQNPVCQSHAARAYIGVILSTLFHAVQAEKERDMASLLVNVDYLSRLLQDGDILQKIVNLFQAPIASSRFCALFLVLALVEHSTNSPLQHDEVQDNVDIENQVDDVKLDTEERNAESDKDLGTDDGEDIHNEPVEEDQIQSQSVSVVCGDILTQLIELRLVSSLVRLLYHGSISIVGEGSIGKGAETDNELAMEPVECSEIGQIITVLQAMIIRDDKIKQEVLEWTLEASARKEDNDEDKNGEDLDDTSDPHNSTGCSVLIAAAARLASGEVGLQLLQPTLASQMNQATQSEIQESESSHENIKDDSTLETQKRGTLWLSYALDCFCRIYDFGIAVGFNGLQYSLHQSTFSAHSLQHLINFLTKSRSLLFSGEVAIVEVEVPDSQTEKEDKPKSGKDKDKAKSKDPKGKQPEAETPAVPKSSRLVLSEDVESVREYLERRRSILHPLLSAIGRLAQSSNDLRKKIIELNALEAVLRFLSLWSNTQSVVNHLNQSERQQSEGGEKEAEAQVFPEIENDPLNSPYLSLIDANPFSRNLSTCLLAEKLLHTLVMHSKVWERESQEQEVEDERETNEHEIQADQSNQSNEHAETDSVPAVEGTLDETLFLQEHEEEQAQKRPHLSWALVLKLLRSSDLFVQLRAVRLIRELVQSSYIVKSLHTKDEILSALTGLWDFSSLRDDPNANKHTDNREEITSTEHEVKEGQENSSKEHSIDSHCYVGEAVVLALQVLIRISQLEEAACIKISRQELRIGSRLQWIIKVMREELEPKMFNPSLISWNISKDFSIEDCYQEQYLIHCPPSNNDVPHDQVWNCHNLHVLCSHMLLFFIERHYEWVQINWQAIKETEAKEKEISDSEVEKAKTKGKEKTKDAKDKSKDVKAPPAEEVDPNLVKEVDGPFVQGAQQVLFHLVSIVQLLQETTQESVRVPLFKILRMCPCVFQGREYVAQVLGGKPPLEYIELEETKEALTEDAKQPFQPPEQSKTQTKAQRTSTPTPLITSEEIKHRKIGAFDPDVPEELQIFSTRSIRERGESGCSLLVLSGRDEWIATVLNPIISCLSSSHSSSLEIWNAFLALDSFVRDPRCTTENQPFLADVLAAWMLSHGSLVYIVSLFDLSKWISSDMKSQSGEIKEQLELTTHSLIRRAIERELARVSVENREKSDEAITEESNESIDKGEDKKDKSVGPSTEEWKELLNAKASFERYHHSCCTVLQASVIGGHLSIAEMLIECGANAAICDSMGRNPLMCSLNFGVDDLAKLLVTKGGANVNAVDDQGDCVLKSAFLSPSSRKLNAYLRMAQSGPSEPVSIVGSARMVKFLLEHGADPNLPDEDGNTPLHWILNGVSKILVVGSIRILLKSNTSAFGPDSDRITKIQELLSFGADVNLCNKQGRTPLHLLLLHGTMFTDAQAAADHVKLLLDVGANPNLTDFWGNLPLHLACRGTCLGTVDILQLLLNSGSGRAVRQAVFCNDTKHLSPRSRLVHRAQLLLEQAYAELIEPSGIHRIQYSREDLVNLKNQYGHSLLHIACGASEIVSQKDSNQEQDFTLEDKPPIQNILVSRLDVVEFLLGIQVEVSSVDKKGRTPLHYACKTYSDANETAEEASIRIVNALIANNADIDAVDSQSRCGGGGPRYSPLHDAIESKTSCWKLLVSHKADPIPSTCNPPPLHLAAIHGSSEELIEYLINGMKDKVECPTQFHVDANIRGQGLYQGIRKFNGTALHLAAENGHTHIIRILLKHSAQVDARRPHNGRTALHLASFNGHLDIVKLLVEEGKADVRAEDALGETPLASAVRGHHLSTVRYLLQESEKLVTADITAPFSIPEYVGKDTNDFDTKLEAGCESKSSNCVLGVAEATHLHLDRENDPLIERSTQIVEFLLDQCMELHFEHLHDCFNSKMGLLTWRARFENRRAEANSALMEKGEFVFDEGNPDLQENPDKGEEIKGSEDLVQEKGTDKALKQEPKMAA